MPALEINVRGSARENFTPERALVHLRAETSGAERDSVYRDAVAVQARLAGELDGLVGRSAVTTWSAGTVHVYSYRPYDKNGNRRDLVYTTDIGVDAEFVDVDELNRFIDVWAVEPGVSVDGIRWDLTEESRRRHEAQLRADAVGDAVLKAQAYADAVGRGRVVPVQLADPDMLADPSPVARGMMLAGAPSGADGGPALDLRARDIELSVQVDARFVVEPD
ncbi:SIMPL domain-containing protein [Gordonia sp. DT219]|uniref:SIMPL domain-containing protein n=1 Tax=Gordonia sp. DT219 TaxID=3416658 RepID=UPI003CFB96CF